MVVKHWHWSQMFFLDFTISLRLTKNTGQELCSETMCIETQTVLTANWPFCLCLEWISVLLHLLSYWVVELGNALVGPVLPQLWQDLSKHIWPKTLNKGKDAHIWQVHRRKRGSKNITDVQHDGRERVAESMCGLESRSQVKAVQRRSHK